MQLQLTLKGSADVLNEWTAMISMQSFTLLNIETMFLPQIDLILIKNNCLSETLFQTNSYDQQQTRLMNVA